ncbi:Uncharacterised protein [Candidatus Anstonella stagnisolia]|nr:Uncharacterised protein [Candidatus Anstonella stagnisolia]
MKGLARTLIFALALFSICSAATVSNFISATFEPDQKVSQGALGASSGSYSLIIVDGTETFVFDNTAGSPVLDKEKIKQILIEDLYSRANFASTLADAKALEAKAQAANDATELKCMQSTGSDMHECTNKDSCILACMSSPLCQSGLLYADGSWESILAWTNEKKKFDASLSSFTAGIDSIKDGGSAIDSKLSTLDSILLSANNISQNPLFLNRTDDGCRNGTRRCFEWCAKIDYSVPSLLSMRSSFVSLKSALAPLGQQAQRASDLLARSTDTQAYVDTRAAKLAAFKGSMASELSSLQRDYSNLPAKDDSIGKRIASLTNLSQSIGVQGDAGYIHLSLSRSAEFSSEATSIRTLITASSSNAAALQKSVDELDVKIQKSSATLGNGTLGPYSLNLSIIKGKLAGKPDASSISAMRAEVSALDSSLDKQIVQASLEGKSPSAPSSGCALPIGFISLVALFAFASKR